MKIAVVDDSKAAADTLIGYIHQYCNHDDLQVVIDYFPNADKFIFHYTPSYDCVFMDIDMPGTDGISCAKELRKIDANVLLLFSTSFAQYAINGYEVDALDYLVKPYRYEEFRVAFERVRKRVNSFENTRIEISNREGRIVVPVNAVYYIEQRVHSHVFHTDSGDYEEYGTMGSLDRMLQKHVSLFRVGASYIINLKYVTKVEGNTLTIKSNDIRISRSRKRDLMQKLNDYLAGEEK